MKVFVSYNAEEKRVIDEDLCGRNVLHYHVFQLLRDCSTSAPPPIYAIAMSLYQRYMLLSCEAAKDVVATEYPLTYKLQACVLTSLPSAVR